MAQQRYAQAAGEGGVAFIETADLDGETNLKTRVSEGNMYKILDEDGKCKSMEELGKLRGGIKCESPNTNLERFDGCFTLNQGSEGQKSKQDESGEQLGMDKKNIVVGGV